MEIWPIEPHPVQRKITQPAGLVSRDLEAGEPESGGDSGGQSPLAGARQGRSWPLGVSGLSAKADPRPGRWSLQWPVLRVPPNPQAYLTLRVLG